MLASMQGSDYKSFGSFAPVYTHAVDGIFASYDAITARQTEKVLRVYAEHADALGMMFPGFRRIMKRAHFSETTVKRCILRLAELDYMRIHVEHSVARQRDIITYQINPRVMWIRSEYISEALNLWEKAQSLDCNVMFNEQPTTEPETETESEPAKEPAENHHHHQRGTSKNDTRKTSPKQRAAHKTENQDSDFPTAQHDNAAQPAAQSAKNPQGAAQNRNTPPHSAPPPPPPDGYDKPLPAATHEDKAQVLHSTFNTRISQMRELVHTHGIPRIDAALTWLSHEKRKGRTIHNEVGLLVWWLNSGHVSADDQPRHESLAGEYRDFIKR